MKRVLILCALVIAVYTIGGCSGKLPESDNGVATPDNRNAPLEGTWLIESRLPEEDGNGGDGRDGGWTGSTVKFVDNILVLGDVQWSNVSYKVRQVDRNEYFLNKRENRLNKIAPGTEDVFIITVSSDDKFIFEVLKLGDGRIVAELDGEYYFMSKVAEGELNDTVKADPGVSLEAAGSMEMEEEQLRSGVLLGIRTPLGDDYGKGTGGGGFAYRTIWIPSRNRNPGSLLEAEGIFLPRKSGFWKLDVRKHSAEGWTEDVIVARSVSGSGEEEFTGGDGDSRIRNDNRGVIRRAILFAGNDYLSVEDMGSGISKDGTPGWQANRLRTVPVDNAGINEGVRLSDIAGENGKLALNNVVKTLLASSNAVNPDEVDEDNLERSIALSRKTGQWYFMGRISTGQDEALKYMDFYINLIPPAAMVAYDILHLPWGHIKDRIPETVDAYTSPNKDIAVVLTKKRLYVYAIKGKELSSAPLCNLELRNGDSVIMAEWATGEYVEIWEKAFRKNNEVMEIVSE